MAAIEPGASSPALIVLKPSLSSQPRFYAELHQGLAGRAWRDFEIWVSGATKEHTARAQFRGRWVGAALDHPPGGVPVSEDWTTAAGGESGEWIIKHIALRFLGYGPVRVFWVDTTSVWLGSEEEPPFSRLEPSAGLLGDAGLALFPILIMPTDPSWVGPQIRKSFSASEFGVEEIVAGQQPGEALKRAIEESETWSSLMLHVPAGPRRWQGLPRELKVLDKSTGRILFRRPFVADGNKASVPPSVHGEMHRQLCRLVKRLPVRSASLTKICNGLKSQSTNEGYLKMEGVEFEAEEPLHSDVMISQDEFGEGMSRGLSHRNGLASLDRVGPDGACVGPVPLRQSDVYVYSPGRGWLAALKVTN